MKSPPKMRPGQALSLPSSTLAGIWGLSVRIRFSGWQIGLRRLGHQSPEQEGDLGTQQSIQKGLFRLWPQEQDSGSCRGPEAGATGGSGSRFRLAQRSFCGRLEQAGPGS